MNFRPSLAVGLVGTVICAAGFAGSSGTSPEARSVEQKLQRLESNAASSRPNPAPTTFSDREVNAYLASDQVEMPNGVETVKLEFAPGTISGTARVDFDKALAGARSSNPLLSMFSGVHVVAAATHAHGDGGKGYVHIDSVSLDGIDVPNFVLQIFIERYLQPKYPQIGLDSKFDLPDRIERATVSEHAISLVQK